MACHVGVSDARRYRHHHLRLPWLTAARGPSLRPPPRSVKAPNRGHLTLAEAVLVGDLLRLRLPERQRAVAELPEQARLDPLSSRRACFQGAAARVTALAFLRA
jgi:hypothetical protein